jgi:hypothetical protein
MILHNPKDPIAYIRHNHKKYNGLYTLKLGDILMLCIGDFAALKDAFYKQGDIFSDRPRNDVSEVLGYPPWIKESGIAFSNGSIWQINRRLALHALREFGMGKKSLEQRIVEEIGFLAKEFDKMEGRPFTCRVFTVNAITNIVCSILFGDRCGFE